MTPRVAWEYVASLCAPRARGLRVRVRGVRLVLACLGACASLALPAHADVAVQVRLDRNVIPMGEATTLIVTVDGAGTGLAQPDVTLPDGVQTLGTSRSQNFAWVNGKSSAQTVFRIELGVDRAGAFPIGPIRVRVGSQWYQSDALTLTVAAERPRVGGSGRGGPADMIVDVSPPAPYVGQPVILRVRLVQRTSLAEDPQYTPPPTPGFWSEKSSPPTSYYADERGARVLVTETRTRLYPLAVGLAHIGEAAAILALAPPSGGSDPFGLFGAGAARRALQVQSPPVDVHVRSLPPGAPPRYDGAVGRFTATWRADRRETPRDVPLVVSLDVRGVGNLPLLHTPAFATPDAEVFSSTVQDSLGLSGTMNPGRRQFQWTVLPRHTGTLRLDPPAFVWFDDASGRYMQVAMPPVTVEVTQPVGGHDPNTGGFPKAFNAHPLDPGTRPARAWGLGLAGLLLGLGLGRARALRLRARTAAAPPPSWVEGLRHARGASFWAAAGRACETLAARGVDVSTWKLEIDAARFGGKGADEERLRGSMLRRLELSAAGSGRPALAAWGLVAGAGVLGLTALVLSLPWGGPAALTSRGLQADTQARRGELDQATEEWQALWRDGGRAPGLAARLAWSAARAGDAVRASAWILRGERGEPRDAALIWTTGQVRDAGGLEGYSRARLPIRNIEWGLVSLIAAVGALMLRWPWRIALLALAGLLAAAPSLDTLRAVARHRAVITAEVALTGQGVDLSPGQVVRVLELRGQQARIEAGPHVIGVVPANILILEGSSR